MDSDGTADPGSDDDLDDMDDDYDVVEAWTTEGAGLAFDGRVLEYFPVGDSSLRVHIRNVDVTVEDRAGGSARIILRVGGTTRAEFDVGADQRAAFLDMIGIVNSTRDLIDTDAGLDHW
jgi:hypothetical protein